MSIAFRMDHLVLSIGTAYSRLTPRSHRQIVEFFTGDRSIAQAHNVACQLIADTSQTDLALILARLLVLADDAVGALELPQCAQPEHAATAHQRRRTDTQQGGR